MAALVMESLFRLLQHNWYLLFRSVLAAQHYVISAYRTLVLL